MDWILPPLSERLLNEHLDRCVAAIAASKPMGHQLSRDRRKPNPAPEHNDKIFVRLVDATGSQWAIGYHLAHGTNKLFEGGVDWVGWKLMYHPVFYPIAPRIQITGANKCSFGPWEMPR